MGKIVVVTVNAQMWADAPGRILVGHHVVRLRRESVWRRRYTVRLLARTRAGGTCWSCPRNWPRRTPNT
ncbi:hypothetical protein WKI71_23650 [Streptomyces sp. MS1.AVA.1]|uniref:Uncharacterized protein n=1 Tax=Streptomyces machairae TaxID=3134109 RepID=A0ABU8UN54_9ACTN